MSAKKPKRRIRRPGDVAAMVQEPDGYTIVGGICRDKWSKKRAGQEVIEALVWYHDSRVAILNNGMARVATRTAHKSPQRAKVDVYSQLLELAGHRIDKLRASGGWQELGFAPCKVSAKKKNLVKDAIVIFGVRA